MSPSSDILTLEELHTYLKIPKPTLYQMAQTRRLPAAKVGKHWRFRKAEIDEWLNAQKWTRPFPRRTKIRKIADAIQ